MKKLRKKILALIIARKGSKGLRGKNLVEINSKPCINWTFQAAIKSKFINFSMLSSDSKKMISMAQKVGIFAPFVRPANLSSDNAKIIDVIWHSIKWLKKNKAFDYEYIILLQATSPLRTNKHIDDAIKYYFKNSKTTRETLVSVTNAPIKTHWLLKQKGKYLNFIFKQNFFFKRQCNPVYYIPNGAIYISKIKYLKNNFFGKKTLFYKMDEKSSIDIDTINDVKKINFFND